MPKIISPQKQIQQLVEPMFPGRLVEVRGHRKTRGAGGKKPPYTAHLIIDGKVVVTAQEKNWRTAYKTLQINISKGNIL
jgi:hypothetical protein